MRPAARLQAAIEILDEVIAATGSNGAAADTLIQRYFRDRRYAGSGDRAAIRELVFRGIRFSAERPASGRSLMLGLAENRHPELLALFDGSRHAALPPQPDEPRSSARPYPAWLQSELHDRFGAALDHEMQALLQRAPLDIRVNARKAERQAIATALGGTPIAGLRHGVRLQGSPQLQSNPLLRDGAIEVQDAGSQHVIEIAAAQPGETVIDLCAGGGGKTLALAADMAGRGRLIATDTNRARLQAMQPRLQRAGVADFVESRLLNPGDELAALADLAGTADLVLVDAPCSGTGTWRRNPELRWRLTPQALHRLHDIQTRLIGIGAGLLKPSGRLIYAVCSVLPSEGPAQIAEAPRKFGLRIATAQSLSPASHGTDGFFVASLGKIC